MKTPVAVGRALLERLPVPRIKEETHKDARGSILVVGGGERVPGATILAGLGALRAGAGKLQLAVPKDVAAAVACAVPEAMVQPVPTTTGGEIAGTASGSLLGALDHLDAVVIGPGTLEDKAAGGLAGKILAAKTDLPCVIDAAAMTGLGANGEAARLCKGRAVLTPHPGEMEKLLGKSKSVIADDPQAAAVEAAAKFDAVVVLKGAKTFIADPDGRCWVNAGGVAGLATSGSGDVLAGVIGGLLARGAPPATAAIWGVFLHAEAGRRLSVEVAPVGFLARELLDRLPAVLAEAGGI